MTGERQMQREKIPPLVRCAHESAPFHKGVNLRHSRTSAKTPFHSMPHTGQSSHWQMPRPMIHSRSSAEKKGTVSVKWVMHWR
jgi:hypothetical protein